MSVSLFEEILQEVFFFFLPHSVITRRERKNAGNQIQDAWNQNCALFGITLGSNQAQFKNFLYSTPTHPYVGPQERRKAHFSGPFCWLPNLLTLRRPCPETPTSRPESPWSGDQGTGKASLTGLQTGLQTLNEGSRLSKCGLNISHLAGTLRMCSCSSNLPNGKCEVSRVAFTGPRQKTAVNSSRQQ